MSVRLSRLLIWVTFAALLTALALPFINVYAMLNSAEEMMACAWMAVGFAVAGYGCALAIERGKLRWWMASALLAGAGAYAVWAVAIWLPRYTDRYVVLWAGTPLTAWILFMMLVGLLSMLRLPNRLLRWVRGITVVCTGIGLIVITLGICCYPIIDDSGSWRDVRDFVKLITRMGSVVMILAGCGAMTIIVGALLPRIAGDEVPAADRLPFEMVCPRCGRRQGLMTEGDACAACGLKIKVAAT
jgi:hypothetical protein